MKGYIVVAALVFSGLAPAATVPAQAAATAPMQTQQQRLSALDPDVRKEVSARMAKGEKFDDVIELLILNKAASQYPDAKFYRVVPPAHTVLVAMPDNTMRSVAYDPATLQLKP